MVKFKTDLKKQIMKRYFYSTLLALLFLLTSGSYQAVQAQDPITAVIQAAVTKAIVAMDLMVQRLQNETIWLQNAQKVLENTLSEIQLTEIADWTERQRQLYAGYYEELWQVKSAITYYQRVQDIIQQQKSLVAEYKRAYSLFRQDENFTPDELDFMYQVYTGILGESIKHLDQLLLLTSTGTTQMSDGKRLELLQQAANHIEQNYSDLREFNAENIRLSLQRAKERNNLQIMKHLYNLPESR